MEPELERRLIARAQQGDMVAYEQLYRAHSGALFHRVIRPRVGSPADAEDVLVDTFTTALERLRQFEWSGRSLFAWLARIAINKSYDVGRRRARDDRGKVVLLHQESVRPAVPRPDEQMEQWSDRQVAREQVEAVLAQLNPRYAQALRLRLLEGRSREECAEALAVKLGTFDVLVLRATRSFRKNWDALYGAGSV